jgi:hypothetical protein
MRVEDGETEEAGLLRAVVGDGTPLLLVAAGSLILAGGFAVFLALTGEFLPHDIRYLGMSAADLCSVAQCRIVRFMIHDRAAFGGALVAVGLLYTYLVLFPLRRGETWAWWLLAISGTAGFLSFLAYLGYGYLDTWHGIGTVLLAPVFVVGLLRSRRLLEEPRTIRVLLTAGRLPNLRSRDGLGRACLLVSAAGVAVAGLEILRIGVTGVFVPEDLAYMGMTVDQLHSVSPRLVPLIAHDRAGFGGAVFTTGLTAVGCLWYSRASRALWQTMLLAGAISLSTAIGIHYAVGYVDAWHLAPPVVGAMSLVAGLVLTYPVTHRRSRAASQSTPALNQAVCGTATRHIRQMVEAGEIKAIRDGDVDSAVEANGHGRTDRAEQFPDTQR